MSVTLATRSLRHGVIRLGTIALQLGALSLGLAAAPSIARAQGAWSAPEECGTRAAVEARIVELAPELRDGDAAFDVSIEREGDRYRASLVIDGDHASTRVLESPECATLTSAIALIVSTAAIAAREPSPPAGDGRTVEGTTIDAATEREEPSPEPEAPREADAQAGPETGAAQPPSETVLADAPRVEGVRALVLAGELVLSLGALPSVEWALVPTVGLHVDGFELLASLLWLGYSGQSVTQFVGRFRVGYVFRIDDLELGPFVVAEVGQLAGTTVELYASVGPAVIARWWPDRAIGLQLAVELPVPVTRRPLADGYVPYAVTALFGVGVILRIP